MLDDLLLTFIVVNERNRCPTRWSVSYLQTPGRLFIEPNGALRKATASNGDQHRWQK